MPVSSRYKTQKINISGPGFYVSGEHDFSKPGTNSENLIFRFSDSIFRLTEVSEFSKPQRGQSTKASGTHKSWNIWDITKFGGRFGPAQKKKASPPPPTSPTPQNSPIRGRHPPGPSSLGFQLRTDAPPPPALAELPPGFSRISRKWSDSLSLPHAD